MVLIGISPGSGTTLLELYGVGPIIAAIILDQVGDPRRFPTRDRFAAYNGTAPLEKSSGPRVRHRPTPAATGSSTTRSTSSRSPRSHTRRPAAPTTSGKLAAGETPKEALRAPKRRISQAVWRQLQLDVTSR